MYNSPGSWLQDIGIEEQELFAMSELGNLPWYYGTSGTMQ